MALLNYTTKISPDKTVLEIERILANHGARTLLKEYDDDGFVSALAFRVNTPHGELGFRLPIDVTATLRVFERQNRVGKMPRQYINEPQARRTGWRIVKVWVVAQMAILETEMVSMEQIFLPYMVMPTGKTLYESMVDSSFLLKEGERI